PHPICCANRPLPVGERGTECVDGPTQSKFIIALVRDSSSRIPGPIGPVRNHYASPSCPVSSAVPSSVLPRRYWDKATCAASCENGNCGSRREFIDGPWR